MGIEVLVTIIGTMVATGIILVIAALVVIKSESLGLRIRSYYKNERRIRANNEDRPDLKTKKKFKPFAQLEGKDPVWPRLGKMVDRSGVSMDSNVFLALWVFGGLVAMLLAFMIAGFLPALGILAVAGVVPFVALTALKQKREKKFTEQLADSLPRIVSSLKSGSTLPAAVNSIAETSSEPIATEFKQVKRATDASIPIEDALFDLADRMESKDLALLAQAKEIQKAAGGSLAVIVEQIAHLIRYRLEMFAKISAITAESRLSAVIAAGAPILLLVFMITQNQMYRDYFLTTETGHICLAIMVVLDVSALLIMRKIYNIKLD